MATDAEKEYAMGTNPPRLSLLSPALPGAGKGRDIGAGFSGFTIKKAGR